MVCILLSGRQLELQTLMSSSTRCLLTFHLELDLSKCLSLSTFPTENLCVSLISPVHFSCPICPTVSQFTPHQHSLTNTKHAATYCAILFTPCYSFCLQTKYLPQPLVQHSISVFCSVEHKHKHIQSNTIPCSGYGDVTPSVPQICSASWGKCSDKTWSLPQRGTFC